MPFKRAAQLKNHLQQQHDAQASTDSVLNAPVNINSTAETLDCPDLASSNSVNALYYNSSPAAVFDVGQQQLQCCDVIAEESDCSVRQCEILPARCQSSQTIKAANIDTGNQIAMVSAVSEACDNRRFSAREKSIAVAPQSHDYVHNSCSESESDLLFSQEHRDSLPLPIPSLTEDSVIDVIATSHASSFSTVHNSGLPSFHRPDITDATYFPWHVHFADAVCSATLPLPGDQLQVVVSVWSSLVSDMTSVMTNSSMSGQQQHYPALLDVVHKLAAVVESHLQILQPVGTTQCCD